MERYVILGSGAAGKRAAEIIRKGKPDAEAVLIGDEPDPFYFRPMLGEFLARSMKTEQIRSRDREKLEALGVRVLTGVRAASVSANKQEVVLAGGERIRFDRLLVATGRKTARPKMAGADARGVVFLDTLEDALKIAVLARGANSAVVVGSSIPALDVLRGLRGKGLACTLLVPEERFWPGVLDSVASSILEERLRQERIDVLKSTGLREIVSADGRLEGLITTAGDRIRTDLLVLAAPQVAHLDFLDPAEFTLDRGVVVDDSLRTRHETIFAAGDAAQAPLADGGATVPQPGWLNAWRQGNVAARNMIGKEAAYRGVLSLRMKAFDLDVVCLGLSDPSPGPTVREESGGYPYEELPYIYKKLTYEKGRVAGAVFVGDVGEAGKVEHWIRQGFTAEQCEKKILDQMFHPRIIAGPALGALCPVCKFQIQVGERDREGGIVTCPACGCEFRLERMPNGVFRAVAAG